MKGIGKCVVLAALAAAVAPEHIDGWATERLNNLDRNLTVLESQAKTHQADTQRELMWGVNALRVRASSARDKLEQLREDGASPTSAEALQREIHDLNVEAKELRYHRFKDPLELPMH